jgi:hypothetical protein
LPPKLTEPVIELLEINLDRKFASALKPACNNFSNLRVDLAPFPGCLLVVLLGLTCSLFFAANEKDTGLASIKWTPIQAALMSFSFCLFSKATGEI